MIKVYLKDRHAQVSKLPPVVPQLLLLQLGWVEDTSAGFWDSFPSWDPFPPQEKLGCGISFFPAGLTQLMHRDVLVKSG